MTEVRNVTDALTKRIMHVYPELKINHVKVNDIGQNNDVLIINDSVVFRFPKYDEGVQRLLEETRLLRYIRNHVTLPIPSPIYQSFEPFEAGFAFTGYNLIQGSPLWKSEMSKIDEKDKPTIAAQLTGFLIELHSLPVDEMKKVIQENSMSICDEMANLFSKIQQKLYPYMRDDAKRDVTHLFESFLNDKENMTITPTLIHGDFGGSNILWCKEKERITGIIDFGGSGIGDPAYDFAGLLSSYGKPFYENCLALYPHGAQVSKRVDFYRGTFALQEALHGIENDDKEAFESGIKDFR